MKRLVAGLAFAVAALAAYSPAVEAQRTTTIGVSAGLSLPTGDLADFQSSGFHVGGQISFSPPSLPVEIMIDGAYHMFERNTDIPASADFSYFSLNGNAVYLIGTAEMRPYLLAGVGMYFGKADVEGAESESEFGFNFGGGFRFMLSGLSTYVGARLHIVDESTFVPISFGVIF